MSDTPLYNFSVVPPQTSTLHLLVHQHQAPTTYIFTPFLPVTQPPVHTLLDFLGGPDYDPSTNPHREPFDRAIRFFRAVLHHLEHTLRLVHYKFVIIPSNPNSPVTVATENSSYPPQQAPPFYLEVLTSHRTRFPVPTLNCISCDSKSEVARASALSLPTGAGPVSSSLIRLWLDANARPMYIVTPSRHVERLSECTDDEIFHIYHSGCLLLLNEFALLTAQGQEPPRVPYSRMTLNHGNARNVEHLHLKIRLTERDFKRIKKAWDADRRASFDRLAGGLYKRDERLKKVKNGSGKGPLAYPYHRKNAMDLPDVISAELRAGCRLPPPGQHPVCLGNGRESDRNGTNDILDFVAVLELVGTRPSLSKLRRLSSLLTEARLYDPDLARFWKRVTISIIYLSKSESEIYTDTLATALSNMTGLEEPLPKNDYATLHLSSNSFAEFILRVR
ncbi:hypothetical protein BC936DRAFT_146073 [Jimgerdemannia flammicorona]|uniref:Uncharacterized protein n=1 Tax=Jimgerdemannia flammicorona TaxID=994334 RepID=A0A433D8G1_9FUNG|nr:hypothetical protein BC936DRAFT_146073 [Jimgerdemannia flammicorona]